MSRILVIRLGALGDFVMSLGPMAAIRRHHAGDTLELLTTRPFAPLGEASGLFDAVRIDTRPRWSKPGELLALRRYLRSFERVYDLQTSSRTALYFQLARPFPPVWSGVARGCALPDDNPERIRIHTIERQVEQLRRAGIADVPFPDLRFATGRPLPKGVRRPYALLVPGAAPHRPGKRWPVGHYGAVAQGLAAAGLQPVVIGGPDERPLASVIAAVCDQALDLTGRTGLLDLPALGAGATVAIGNDTGPMHIFAIAGAPSVVLFSAESDPVRTAPRAPGGRPRVVVLQREKLATLAADAVLKAALAQTNTDRN